MLPKKIMLVFGTRPEAIKMAPIILALQQQPEVFKTVVCVTGQHREMLDQVLTLFNIVPDFDLDIMKPGQDLYEITSKILIKLRDVLHQERPDLVLVHGDTTTSMSAALAAFYQQIPIGHIEAGLRTNDIYNPWPEEINRQLTGRLATYHFAPTVSSKKNLLSEAISEEKIIVTGNTVIDALHWVVQKIASDQNILCDIKQNLYHGGYDCNRLKNGKKMVLITGHRRENFGDGFNNICKAIKHLNLKFPDADFVYPMHLNPNVRIPIKNIFGLNPPSNMFFIEPLDYLPFVFLMQNSYLVLTDSGGIQEEAPGLGKPVLVMRNTTERPEAVESGTVKLVGTNVDKIIEGVSKLLENNEFYNFMCKATNPYGDGSASFRIVNFITTIFKGDNK